MLPRDFGVHRKPFNKKEFLQRVRNQQKISNKERENCQARQLNRQRISEDGVFFWTENLRDLPSGADVTMTCCPMAKRNYS